MPRTFTIFIIFKKSLFLTQLTQKRQRKKWLGLSTKRQIPNPLRLGIPYSRDRRITYYFRISYTRHELLHLKFNFKERLLEKLSIKINIFYKKRKIINCFLIKVTKNRKNIILLVFISNN